MKQIFTIVFFVFILWPLSGQNASFSWFMGGGSARVDRSQNVVTDSDGNLYLTNSFQETSTFNGVIRQGAARGSGPNFDNSLLITKLNPGRQTLWTIHSNQGAVSPAAIATTPHNQVVFSGSIRAIVNTAAQTSTANLIDAAGNVTTFSGLLSTTAGAQTFVAKADVNGVVLWVREFHSTGKTTGVTTTALAADQEGNVIVAGTFVNNVIVPGNPVPYVSLNTAQSAFLTKLNRVTGEEMWTIVSSGGISSENIPAITVAADGSIYAAGIYRNVATPALLTIGSHSFTPSSNFSLVLKKINNNGQVVYISSRNNNRDTRITSILAHDALVFISGSFRGEGTGILFDTPLTTPSTFLNGYVAAFEAATGNDVWQKAVLSPGITDVGGLAVGVDGLLYAFGGYANRTGTTVPAADVDFGNQWRIVDTNPSNTSADLYLAAYHMQLGHTMHVQTIASSPIWETANGMAWHNDRIYMLGTTNSVAATVASRYPYTTLGGFDILLLAYQVFNPSTSIIDNGVQEGFVRVHRVNNRLTIQHQELMGEVSVYNAQGQLLWAERANSNEANVSTEGFASGVYVVRVTTKAGLVQVQKVLIP